MFEEKDMKLVYDEEKPEAKPKKAKASKKPTITVYSKVKDEPVKTIRRLISLTETAMQERLGTWKRHNRKYRRGLYYLKGSSSGVPLYFTNYIYANIESTKAHLTRNLPSVSASPRGQKDDNAADLMTRVLQDAMLRGGLKKHTRKVVHYALLNSVGYYKVYFSDDKDGVVVDSIATEYLLVDPKAESLHDARWITHRRPDVPIDEIYAQYGVIPEEYDPESFKSEDSINSQDGTYTTRGESRDAVDVGNTYDVYETWIRCWEEDRENDWYVVTIAGGTVLEEKFSPYDHNKHPFVAWFAGEDFTADNIYYRGIGGVEEIEPLQDRADAVDLKIYKHISLLTNRQRYVSQQTGLSIENIDNTSGRTYLVNGDPNKAVYYDSPPQMPMEIYNYRDRTEMLIQTVSGIFDVTQGRRPTGITAGRAIESLKDSAEMRLGAYVETLAESQEEVADLGLRIILQFYDGERMINSVDGDKDIEFKVVADYPPELQPQPTPRVDELTGNMLVDEETGGYQFDEEEELSVDEELLTMREEWKAQSGIMLVLSDVTYDWDIRANSDTALPSAKKERAQVAADMFRLGAIDRQALLEAIEYPDRYKILKRLAADVTGKDAGDPNAEAQIGAADQMMQMFQQILGELGLPEDQIAQVMEMMMQQTSGEQATTGNYQPQIAQ